MGSSCCCAERAPPDAHIVHRAASQASCLDFDTSIEDEYQLAQQELANDTDSKPVLQEKPGNVQPWSDATTAEDVADRENEKSSEMPHPAAVVHRTVEPPSVTHQPVEPPVADAHGNAGADPSLSHDALKTPVSSPPADTHKNVCQNQRTAPADEALQSPEPSRPRTASAPDAAASPATGSLTPRSPDSVPCSTVQTPRTLTRQWEKKHARKPLYHAGGPYGRPQDDDEFAAPDMGDAAYLVYNTTHAGTLKLVYAKSASSVKDRIIAGCKLLTTVPNFKFKTPTQLATSTHTKIDELYRGIGGIIRAARQHHGELAFYPLPPGFTPFAVVYHFHDDMIKVQFAGDPPVLITDSLTVAAVTDVASGNKLLLASKVDYHVFKNQFAHEHRTSLLDFQRDLVTRYSYSARTPRSVTSSRVTNL